MLKATLGIVAVLTAATGQAQTGHRLEAGASVPSWDGPVLPISTLPAPLLRYDPALAQEFQNRLDEGDIEVGHTYGPVGAGLGFVAGAYLGGTSYLTMHGVNSYQGATFVGVMAATLLGGFVGAYYGATGSVTVFFMQGHLSLAVSTGVAFIDSIYQEVNQVGGQ